VSTRRAGARDDRGSSDGIYTAGIQIGFEFYAAGSLGPKRKSPEPLVRTREVGRGAERAAKPARALIRTAPRTGSGSDRDFGDTAMACARRLPVGAELPVRPLAAGVY
jgi:hypothetical protein